MGFLWITRVAVLSAVVLFSIIELGLSAGYIAKLQNVDGFFQESTPAWAGLALAVAIISLFTLGPMVVIDFLRRGALTSWVMIELIVTGLLMVLWLATAADTASATAGLTLDCGAEDQFDTEAGTFCHLYQGIEAFAFLNWILLTIYFGLLLTYALIGHSRGNAPWRGTVRDTQFTTRGGSISVPMTQQPTGNTYAPVTTQHV